MKVMLTPASLNLQFSFDSEKGGVKWKDKREEEGEGEEEGKEERERERETKTTPTSRKPNNEKERKMEGQHLNNTWANNPSMNSTDSVASLYPLKILVAEDNEMNTRLISRILKRMGYVDVEFVENGKQVCDLLQVRDFDYILMDIQMPIVDGIECTKQIRAQYGSAWPFIVSLTANTLPSNEIRCINAGMNVFLTKPIQLHLLHKSFQSAFHIKSGLPPNRNNIHPDNNLSKSTSTMLCLSNEFTSSSE